MSEIKYLPKYEHRMIHYKFDNYVQERDCVWNINKAYEKGRAEERSHIVEILFGIDRQVAELVKEILNNEKAHK